MDKIKQTSDVISEKPILLRFGFLWFLMRPLTLSQIYEIGAIVQNIEEVNLPEGEFNPVVEMLRRYTDMKICSSIVVKMLFRRKLKRILFGWYVKKHLTMAKYKKVIEFGAMSFQAAFFLTSFTFLKGTKEVTKQTNTESVTHLGDSSVE